MRKTDSALADFFAEYERRTNQALADPPDVDIEASANAFADFFIGASPKGVRCGANDAELRAAIPQGFEFYRSIRTKSMRIVRLTTTPLDQHHSMVKVHYE